MDQRKMTTHDWSQVSELVGQLVDRLEKEVGLTAPRVYGIPTGGAMVAALVKARCPGAVLVDDPAKADLVVDDLVDSGRTALAALEIAPQARFDALIRKSHSPAHLAPGASLVRDWAVFPWEQRMGGGSPRTIEDSVVRLLEWVGENPTREGLIETPKRVAKAYREMTEGYRVDLDSIVRVFDEGEADEMVVLRGIRFVSLCEHHLLPFHGEASVGYLPRGGRVIGLSKLARITHAFARRLQVQERLTRQVAEYLMGHGELAPLGVGVVLKAHHSCMSCRGIRELNAEMVTSATLGKIRDHEARSEFLRLAGV
jgi:GTP cyclohydrolase I